jgi:hypothetical protein
MPVPQTKAEWKSLALAQEAEREGKDAPHSSEPRKPLRVGRPPLLNTAIALLYSARVFYLMDNHEMSERDACNHVWSERLRNRVCKLETFRKQVSAFDRMLRGKLIPDEKFKAKLRNDRDKFFMFVECVSDVEPFSGEAKSEELKKAKKLVNEAVNKLLGEN